jgi:hypothetical protein
MGSTSKWKYLWYPEGAVEQLFNLELDPQELINRTTAPDCQAILEELRSAAVSSTNAQRFGLSRDGELTVQAREEEPVEHWRNLGWPGLHTERYAVDVRH